MAKLLIKCDIFLYNRMQIGVEEISKSHNPKLKLDFFLQYFGQKKKKKERNPKQKDNLHNGRKYLQMI